MKLHHWLIIIFIQIVLVAVGLCVYHSYVGQTGIDAGNAITIWATVITIVFIIFSVIGIMNIEGKIRDVEEARQKQEAKYNEIFELCREKGLKISGDMFARLISIYQEQDLYIDHSIVYCPGICLAVFLHLL